MIKNKSLMNKLKTIFNEIDLGSVTRIARKYVYDCTVIRMEQFVTQYLKSIKQRNINCTS